MRQFLSKLLLLGNKRCGIWGNACYSYQAVEYLNSRGPVKEARLSDQGSKLVFILV
jgi:hypothetical protein